MRREHKLFSLYLSRALLLAEVAVFGFRLAWLDYDYDYDYDYDDSTRLD